MYKSTGLFSKSPSLPTWSPGTYSLINVRSNTAADLSGGDYKSIIGYSLHGGDNQQWEFISSRNGYVIRSIRTPRHIGQPIYMSVEGEVKEKALVVATTQRMEWTVEQTSEGLRISSPNSNLVIEMGDGTSGPQLMLQTLVLGDVRQLWRFVRCPQPEPEPQPEWVPGVPTTNETDAPRGKAAVVPATINLRKHEEVVVESARALSDPTTTETVTTSESTDYITMTRTTTTTVITTVTEVIRTPKAPLVP